MNRAAVIAVVVLAMLAPASAAAHTLTAPDAKTAIRAWWNGSPDEQVTVSHCKRASAVAVSCRLTVANVAGPFSGGDVGYFRDRVVVGLRHGRATVLRAGILTVD